MGQSTRPLATCTRLPNNKCILIIITLKFWKYIYSKTKTVWQFVYRETNNNKTVKEIVIWKKKQNWSYPGNMLPCTSFDFRLAAKLFLLCNVTKFRFATKVAKNYCPNFVSLRFQFRDDLKHDRPSLVYTTLIQSITPDRCRLCFG